MQEVRKIAVIGSGLVGSLLAIFLRKRGHEVTIFDRRPDVRTMNFPAGQLTWQCLTAAGKLCERLGIEDRIKEIAMPLDKRAMHVNDRPMYFQKYGKEGEAIYSISRGVLNRKMIDLAEEAGAVFQI
jgi:kynurenine 3-monooxygenase